MYAVDGGSTTHLEMPHFASCPTYARNFGLTWYSSPPRCSGVGLSCRGSPAGKGSSTCSTAHCPLLQESEESSAPVRLGSARYWAVIFGSWDCASCYATLRHCLHVRTPCGSTTRVSTKLTVRVDLDPKWQRRRWWWCVCPTIIP